MFETIENIKLVRVYTLLNLFELKVKNRKDHIFAVRTQGSGYYEFGDKIIECPRGSIIFIPKGQSYTFKKTSEESCSSIIIRFSADMDNPVPSCYSLDKFTNMDMLISTFLRYKSISNPSIKHRYLSVLHSLISYLITVENTDYSDKKKLKLLLPAIDYLEEHIFDTSLKFDSLHLLCDISPAYFRKIFSANFGLSPQKYAEDKRLSHAYSIIVDGEAGSISDLALSTGYTDALYFSKIFKRKYGISPSYLAKQHKE